MSTTSPTATAPRAARGRRSKRMSGDDREREILATAERLVAERSIHDISVDDLARGAGISRPSFYFYFPSKEAVLLTLLDRVVAEARSSRDDLLASLSDNPEEAWRVALTAVYDTFRSHGAVMLATAELFSNDEVSHLWGRIMEDFVLETAAAIEHEQSRQLAPRLPIGVEPRDLAVALNWMNERIFHVLFAEQAPAVDPDKVIDVLLTIWLRAIYVSDSPTPLETTTARPAV